MKKIIFLAAIVTATFTSVNLNAQDAKTAKPVEGLEVGNIAPNLNFSSPDGKQIDLKSLRGNIVLIDFWASWCGPCRRENPHVVAAYQKYHSMKFKKAKSFTIYSVSLDREKENWIKAIAQDKLEWTNHVSDLKYWSSEAAQKYGVQSIPTNWLLDEKGIIVAKNMLSWNGHSLEEELDKLK